MRETLISKVLTFCDIHLRDTFLDLISAKVQVTYEILCNLCNANLMSSR